MSGRSALTLWIVSVLVAMPTLHGCHPGSTPTRVDSGVAWVEQVSGTDASLRGVSAVSATVAWASGTGGTCLRTVDGGRTWLRVAAPGAERLDFRDIEALDADTAWLMATAGRIYRTTDGGASWQLQLADDQPGVFLDAIAFWNGEDGIAFGDPVDGAFLVLLTNNGGRQWRRVEPSFLPPPLPGEVGFAGSGTCLTVKGTDDAWFGTGGGPAARVFHSSDRGRSWRAVPAPLVSATASAGIFGLAFADHHTGVAVGGDYSRPRAALNVAALTRDGGRTWRPVRRAAPAGYRSGVAFAPGLGASVFVAVGTSGADISRDTGETWMPLCGRTLNSISCAAQAPVGWAVGPKGRIVRLEGTEKGLNSGARTTALRERLRGSLRAGTTAPFSQL